MGEPVEGQETICFQIKRSFDWVAVPNGQVSPVSTSLSRSLTFLIASSRKDVIITFFSKPLSRIIEVPLRLTTYFF